MRICVSGSRSLTNRLDVERLLETPGLITPEDIIVCGYDLEKKLPKGVDEITYYWAKKKGIKIELYPANWTKYGKPAGPIRNQQMIDVSDFFIAIHDGKSTGTAGAATMWKNRVSILFNDPNYNCKIFKLDPPIAG